MQIVGVKSKKENIDYETKNNIFFEHGWGSMIPINRFKSRIYKDTEQKSKSKLNKKHIVYFIKNFKCSKVCLYVH